MNNQNQVTLKDLKYVVKDWLAYLLPKWPVFLIVAILFALLGVLYAWLEKPSYTAELTFAAENESSGSIGAYAGLAAQFGLDLGLNGGNAFEGENLIHLMRSRKLIEKTLFSHLKDSDNKTLLINYYIAVNKMDKALEPDGKGPRIVFTRPDEPTSRKRDSILQKIGSEIGKALEIEKVDKKSDIILVRFKDNDELFAKNFVEELVNNVILYYTNYKVQKTRQNVAVLQRQTDSVRNLINGNIVDIAVSNDLNVNPTRQIVRTGIQRKQVDAQVNGALYTELVKNLELSKLSLRKETPLIQIIDTPMLPLKKKKKGRLFTGIAFAFIGGFLTFGYYASKKLF